jgi:hypothetical protein
MEITFSILIIYIKDRNHDKIRENILLCKKLFEEGGDWEKKNKLKVFIKLINILF